MPVARYRSVRHSSEPVSQGLVVATGVSAEGTREVLGTAVGDSESFRFWREFLTSLKSRGLAGVHLVISDAHAGLKAAVAQQFSGSSWQRCRVHFMRNLHGAASAKHAPAVTAPEFRGALTEQVADVKAPKADAESRGWTDDAARHERVAHALRDHLQRLDPDRPLQTCPVQREGFLERVASLRMASRGGGERYPHKPLLLLWLLGRMQQHGTSACTYEEAEKPVSRLLDDFGPPSRQRYRAAMPFVHLESDLWELSGEEGQPLKDTRASLCRAHAKGRLRPEVEELLRKDPALIVESARLLIDLNFTPTYLDPICADVGLDLEAAEEAAWRPRKLSRPRRRPGFRSEVLHGWRNRCAMCGYDGALGRDPAGLDAAHVFWHSQGGPDDADNGLALCSLHHVLFDLGALGLNVDLSVRVSPQYVARSELGERLVYHLDGRPLLDPAPKYPAPSTHHVEWHSKQVFKDSA